MIIRSISMALGLVSGVLLVALCGGTAPAWLLALVALVGILVTAWLVWEERHWRAAARVVLIAGAVLMTAPVGIWRAGPWVGPPAGGSFRHAVHALPEGQAISIGGIICAEPEIRSDTRCDMRVRVSRIKVGDALDWQDVTLGTVMLRASLSEGSGPGAVALFRDLSTPRAYGYDVEVRTTHRPPAPPMNPGSFDRPRFLRQGGLVAEYQCRVSRIRLVERSRGFFLTEVALAAKQSFLGTYRRTIRSPASRLVAAATLGSRRAVETITYAGKDIPEMLRHAGVGHVLAVSGLHVSVVSLLLFSMFAAAGVRPRVFTPLLILFLVLFALLTGARPSSLRAVVMNAAVLATYAYTRRNLRDATYFGLSLSASVIILIRPLVLFSPSFLLSYGAVLSLVLIAPVLDRWLCLLRGGSLLLSGAWFAALLATLAFCPQVWLVPLNVVCAGALLWLAVYVGARWNERSPRLWRIGLESLPVPARLFVGAQLAIQVGMMIPLSAWFFGRFPAAGIVVNLVAIPAIGVLVQLGILVGLLGLVPGVGLFLALPFGTVATLVGQFFFALAYAGTALFPFVAVPKPTLAWMLGYYLCVGAVLSVASWGARAHGMLLRRWPGIAGRKWARCAPYAIAIALLLLPCHALIPRAQRTRAVTVCSTRDYPVITLLSDADRAVLINGGDEFTGGYVLFNVIRSQGAASVDLAILASPNPRAGNAGLVALMQKMPVKTCYAPFVADDGESFLRAVGDDYLAARAGEGKTWALAYVEAYDALIDAARDRELTVERLPDAGLRPWGGLHVEAMSTPDSPPPRFITSAMTPLLDVAVGGSRWVVVTDSTPEGVRAAANGDAAPVDVLVLPSVSYRKDFLPMVSTALECFSPRVVIMPGKRLPAVVKRLREGCSAEGCVQLFATGEEGAVSATFREDGALELSAMHSSVVVTLSTDQP